MRKVVGLQVLKDTKYLSLRTRGGINDGLDTGYIYFHVGGWRRAEGGPHTEPDMNI